MPSLRKTSPSALCGWMQAGLPGGVSLLLAGGRCWLAKSCRPLARSTSLAVGGVVAQLHNALREQSSGRFRHVGGCGQDTFIPARYVLELVCASVCVCVGGGEGGRQGRQQGTICC